MGVDLRALRLLIDATGMKTGADDAVRATDAVSKGAEKAARAVDGVGEKGNLTSKVLGKLKEKAVETGVALAALFTLKGVIDEADQMGKLAAKTGVAVEALSALKWQADQSDLAFGDLTIGLKQFSEAIVAAQAGDKTASETFSKLGVNVRAFKGDLNETQLLLAATAQQFSKFEGSAEKAALAGNLFGRSGLTWIPLLNDGAEGMKKAREALDQSGGTLTAEQSKVAQDFNDAWTRAEITIKRLLLEVVEPFLSILEPILDGISWVVGQITSAASVVKSVMTGVTPGEYGAQQNRGRVDGYERGIGGVTNPAADAKAQAAADKAAEDVRKQIADAEQKRIDEVARAIAKGADAEAQARAAIEESLRTRQREIDLIGSSEEQRREAAAVAEVEAAAIDRTTGALRVNADTFERAKDAARALAREQYAKEQADRAATDAMAAMIDEIFAEKTARDGLGDKIRELTDDARREAEQIGLTTDERELANAQLAVEALLADDATDAERALAEEYLRQVRALQTRRAEYDNDQETLRFMAQLEADYERDRATAAERARKDAEAAAAAERKAREERLKGARETVQSLDEELSMLGKTADQRRRMQELYAFDRQYKNDDGTFDKEVEAARRELEARQEMRAEMERIQDLAFRTADTLTTGFEDAVLEGKSLASIVNSISRIGLETFVGNPLRNALGSGLFGLFGGSNAHGNIFTSGDVTPFANGGVVSSPTFFPMSRGRAGLMGEDGPEAIVPLPDGRRIPVEVRGGGSVVVNQTNNFYGGGGAYGGVYQSARQAKQAAQDALERR